MRYIFGDYMLDTQRHELHHAGAPIKLRRKVFQVLVYLLAHCDRVIPKQELLEQLWPAQFVGDETLTSCIKSLRKALGERGRTARFLRTLHGQGYRFVGAVEVWEHTLADEAPQTLPRRADKGRYGASLDPPPLPSPLRGEGLGGGEGRAPLPSHPLLPPPGGKGPVPTLVSPRRGGEGAIRQAEGPSSALSSTLADLGSPPWEALDAEHKQVTVLCGALAEAPMLGARLGPEAMYHLMHDVLALAQDTVQRYEGTLTQVSGEGFVALFGAPVAQEDHARRAVLAALELRQRLHMPHALRWWWARWRTRRSGPTPRRATPSSGRLSSSSRPRPTLSWSAPPPMRWCRTKSRARRARPPRSMGRPPRCPSTRSAVSGDVGVVSPGAAPGP
jgi:DNA-binding winged helix-turn-helix (wHTH) protein